MKLKSTSPTPAAKTATASPTPASEVTAGPHGDQLIDPGPEETASPQPDPEAIAIAAYHIYLAKGREDSTDVDHWLEAERNLLNPA